MELKMKVSKKTWKRWLAAVLSICLCLSCFQTPVLAQGEIQSIEKEQVKQKDSKKNSDIMTMSYNPETINVGDVKNVTELTLDQVANVTIQNPEDVQYLSFTPTEDGTYYFYSESTLDTYGALYSLSENLYRIYEYNDLNFPS